MEQERFESLKTEILKRARNASACLREYCRAYKAKTIEKLNVIRYADDNMKFEKIPQ